MQTTLARLGLKGFLALGLALVCAPGIGAAEDVRLGWQVPWATQGQIVMALRHTNIGELTATSFKFIGFTYGAPLNRAALSNEVDILLTADQPSLVLLARDQGHKIVGRLMYNRVCLYVPPASPVRSAADLRGKQVAGPVGAAAERFAMAALEHAGVPKSAVSYGSLDMGQQAPLIRQSPGAERWGGADAFYGFDPLPAIWEEEGLLRFIDCGRVVAVIVASKDMITKRRKELVRVLQAFLLAWNAYRSAPQRFNRLFADNARMTASDRALNKAAEVEPNWQARTFEQIRMTFNAEDRAILNEARDFIVHQGIIPNIDPAAYIDESVLQEAVSAPGLAGLAAAVR
jgi:ABC-type nitrate/sulfonate/bicarbonate transport system substrate-binding protein